MARTKRVSLRTLAAQCGVSVATASRALNGDKNVAPATRAKVERKARELGYEPATPPGPRRRGIPKIGILAKSLSTDYYAQLNVQLTRFFEEHGIQAVCYDLATLAADPKAGFETLLDCGVSGVAVVGCSYKELEPLLEPGVGTVWIDCNEPADETPGLCRVQSDHFVSGQLAAHALLSVGKRRPLLIAGSSRTHRSLERVAGFESEFEKAGVGLPEEYVFVLPRIGRAFDEARDLVQYQLVSGRDFDSVFAVSDWGALGAYAAVKAAGKRVPEDVGVIGFDGTSLASNSVYSITSIQQNVPLLARHAGEMLLAQLEGRPVEAASVVVPTTLHKGLSL